MGQVQRHVTGLQAIPSNIWLTSGSKDLWGMNDCHPDSTEQRGILLGVGWGGVVRKPSLRTCVS